MTLRGLINTPPIMRRHPLTGKPIEPVGIVGNKVVWPCMGGAPDPDEDDDLDDKDDKDDIDDSGADDKVDKDKDAGGADTLEAALKRAEELERRMKAADRRAEQAEKKIKDAERAEQDELTRAKSDLEEKEKELQEAQKTVTSLRLTNAFLTANKHNWHDPDTALALAETGGYLEDVMGDDGVVDKKALGSALDRLAKDKGYLVKTKEPDDDDEPEVPSGEPAGGRSDNAKDRKARQKQLKSRFSSLSR